LSRECSLEQIKKVVKNSKVPIEVFVHGAMCVSISGRCFLSQALHFKNANRGECMQSCRQQWLVTNNNGELVYDGERFLNAKDLCMIEHLPLLVRSGVKSLKIEGRMRDANYVSTVVSVYREALDHWDKSKIKGWRERLASVFNRGFCNGFYFGRPDTEVVLDKADNQSIVRKVFVGEVVNYYRKQGVAEVKLFGNNVKLGDILLFEGSCFLKQPASSLEINHKKVKSAKKGNNVAIKVGKKVRVGDQVYKIYC
jgi:putative protease